MLYQVHFYLKKNVTAGGMGHWVKVLANKLGELSSNPQGSHGGRENCLLQLSSDGHMFVIVHTLAYIQRNKCNKTVFFKE